MKFYSEVLKKFFDTEEACVSAEADAKAAETKEKEALEAIHAIEKEYMDMIADFVAEYGYYKSPAVKTALDDDILVKKLFTGLF